MILFRDGQEAARLVGALPKGRLMAALRPEPMSGRHASAMGKHDKAYLP